MSAYNGSQATAQDGGTNKPKKERDQLTVETEAWLRTVTHARLPNGSKLPGNAYKVADDIARNHERGFNRTIFEHTGLLEAWPAIPTIMKATGLSKSTVERMLVVLQEAGCLKVKSGRGRHKSNRFQAIQNATTVRHFSEPDQQAENASVLSGKCLNPEAENASTVRHHLTEGPVEGTTEEASKGKTPPSPSRKQGPAVDHLVAESINLKLVVISTPQADLVEHIDDSRVEVLEERQQELVLLPPDASNVAIIKPKRASVPINGAGHDDGFAEFWSVYPKKVDKIDAEKAYRKARQSGVEAATIIAGARLEAAKFAADKRPRDEVRKYTKHPATFLNKGSYANVEEAPSSPLLEAAARLLQRRGQ